MTAAAHVSSDMAEIRNTHKIWLIHSIVSATSWKVGSYSRGQDVNSLSITSFYLVGIKRRGWLQEYIVLKASKLIPYDYVTLCSTLSEDHTVT